MTRTELKEIITENFDRSLFQGEATFHVKAREDMEMTFEPTSGVNNILWVDLNFGNGLIRLEGKNYTREEMINIYTAVVSAIWFDYDV